MRESVETVRYIVDKHDSLQNEVHQLYKAMNELRDNDMEDSIPYNLLNSHYEEAKRKLIEFQNTKYKVVAY